MPIGIGLGVAGIAGAGISAVGANKAASTQANAEQSAAQQMEQQYLQTRSDLLPYNAAGQTATSQLAATKPFSFGSFNYQPTEAQLQETPGYQFNLYQGEKATQNSYAAQGLGSSGAALKGAATYASGLADSTYQNQFNNALQSYQTQYNAAQGQYTTNLNRLQGLASIGENAGAQTGNFGTQTAANIGATAVGAANASAAGTVGVASAASGGLNSLANPYLLNSFYNNSGIYGGGSAGGAPNPADYSQTGFGDSSDF